MLQATISNSIVEKLEERRQKALGKIAPNILHDEDANWQKRKSSQTRIFLLRSTLDCLAEYGYAITTTQLVTQKAGISRGALLHHFATKQDLIKEVIDYTFYCQLDNFFKKIIQLSEQQRVSEIAGIDIYWNFMKTHEFQAYQELAMASRTDLDLREIFEPKDIQFKAIWEEQLPYLFPEWQDRLDELRLAQDLIQTCMQGLLINMHQITPRSRRAILRKLIAMITSQLMTGDIAVPKVTKAEISKVE